MTPVIWNLGPLRRGGGLQAAESLVRAAAEASASDPISDSVYLVNAETVSAVGASLEAVRYRLVEPTDIFSLRRTAIRLADEINAKAILSPFGTGIGRTHIPQVVGSAYGNLYFPEIDFWSDLSAIGQARKRFRDMARLAVTRMADYWFFETEEIRQRAIARLRVPARRTAVVPPARPTWLEVLRETGDTTDSADERRSFDVLVPGSWHSNKRLHLLPDVINEIERQAPTSGIRFVATVEHGTVPADFPSNLPRTVFTGKLGRKGLVDHYRTASAVALFSRLESFSNTILEAWEARRPLIVSDASWAHRICKSGAIYVDPSNATQAASDLIVLEHEAETQAKLVRSGERLLMEFPTPEQRHRAIHDLACNL